MILKPLTSCSVCNNLELIELWDLPKYPFTETFGAFTPSYPTVDQLLMWCSSCNHVQLSNLVDSQHLYNLENYALRTLSTPKIEKEISFLNSFIFQSIVKLDLNPQELHAFEFGGNNLGLAKLLEGKFASVSVCDPIAPNLETASLNSFSMTIEDFVRQFSNTYRADVVIARHTLEHVHHPLEVLNSLQQIANNGTLNIFIECPSLEQIIFRFRWDTVTHQHIHYFSIRSMVELFKNVGYRLVDYKLNSEGSNGGSVIYHFTNDNTVIESLDGKGSANIEEFPLSFSYDQMRFSLNTFKKQSQLIQDYFSIKPLRGRDFCFGASLLLPTLNYHLNGLVEYIGLVLDDDKDKSGIGYKNLHVDVVSPDSLNFKHDRFLITSLENSGAIMKSLMNRSLPNVFCILPITAG